MRDSSNENITDPEGATIQAGPAGRWLRYGSVSALLLVIVFFAFVRVRLRDVPLERDEGEFAYVGQLMLQGIPPYKIAFNMKLPGTYAAYAATMAVFGETASGLRMGLMLVNVAATILVFSMAKYLYGPLAGAVAGMTYSFLSCRPAVLGIYGHATHFVVLAALAGILLLLHAIETGRIGLFFWQRTLSGAGVSDEAAGNSVCCFRGILLVVAGMEATVPVARGCDARGRIVGWGGITLWADVPDTFPGWSFS